MVKKMKKEEAERIAREQLKNVGLLDHANHYPRHMSGGQQQRVGNRKSTCDGAKAFASG